MAVQASPVLRSAAQHGRSLRDQAATWFATAADYFAAAYAYERLSGLSDAELQRRGLSRADTGRAACAACDRMRETGRVNPRT